MTGSKPMATSPPTLAFPLAAFGAVDWVILAVYLVGMLVIGLVAAWRESRQQSGTAEFFLGGRSLPTWVLAISIVGSSLTVVIWVLGLLIWDRFAVVMRSATQQIRAREFITAAQALGYSIIMGLLGGFFPAWRAARLPVVTALREL